MPYSVCFFPPSDDSQVNEWAYVLSHYIPERVYLLCDAKDLAQTYTSLRDGIKIDSAKELPNEVPLVIVAPKEGRYIQGDVDLVTYDHPENCVYLFGPDHLHLSEDQLGGRVGDRYVYISSDSHHEMYSHIAAAITFYDRAVKRGR